MKIIIILILITLSCGSISAQLNHYVSYNNYLFGDFYNEEMDNIDMAQSIRVPMGSYKVEWNRLGLELSVNHQDQFYHAFTPQDAKAGDLLHSQLTDCGIALQYAIVETPWLKVYPMLGVIRSAYYSMTLDAWRFTSPTYNEALFHNDKETKYGLVTGLNMTIPVYKRVYFNSNLRYSIKPTARYNKRNLMTSIGIGYRFGKEQKEDKK